MARIAENEHPDISLDKGDLVIFSSRTIPGQREGRRPDPECLVRMGCELLTDGDALVHVTGHPRRDELRQLYAWTAPQDRRPDARRGAPSEGARAISRRSSASSRGQIAYNGEIVRLAPGPVRIIDDAPVGRLFRDGRLIVPSEDGPVRERRKLAHRRHRRGRVGACHAAASCWPIRRSSLDGVPPEDRRGRADVRHRPRAPIEGTLKSIPPQRRRDARDGVRRPSAALSAAPSPTPGARSLLPRCCSAWSMEELITPALRAGSKAGRTEVLRD